MSDKSDLTLHSTDHSLGGKSRQRKHVPCTEYRIMGSYVLLTLLSAYVIYDYRLRPDCFCHPRPYVFAVSAFALNGLYGIMGLLNRMARCDPCRRNSANELIYFLQMTLVLPLFASEAWSIAKVLKKCPELVHVHMAAAVPGIASYLFRKKKKTYMMDLSLAYSMLTLFYISTGCKSKMYSIYAILAGICYLIGYCFTEKQYCMPYLECLPDEEVSNYFFVYPDQKKIIEILIGIEVLLYSTVLPYLATEMWILNRFYPKLKYIPQIIQSVGYPTVNYYYFFHKPLQTVIELLMIGLIGSVFGYMTYMKGTMYFLGTALLFYTAFNSSVRFPFFPILECLITQQEMLNYSLCASMLCASIAMA